MEIPKPKFLINDLSILPTRERKVKRRVFKRSFFRKKIYLVGKVRKPRKLSRVRDTLDRKKIHKPKYGRIFIRLKRLNVFLTLTRGKSNHIKLKTSTGCTKYRGKKRASPLAKKITMQNFVRRLVARNFRILDVFFCRRIGRTYKTLLTL